MLQTFVLVSLSVEVVVHENLWVISPHRSSYSKSLQDLKSGNRLERRWRLRGVGFLPRSILHISSWFSARCRKILLTDVRNRIDLRGTIMIKWRVGNLLREMGI